MAEQVGRVCVRLSAECSSRRCAGHCWSEHCVHTTLLQSQKYCSRSKTLSGCVSIVSAASMTHCTQVRGTGASGGQWRMPWGFDERRDTAQVLDWIVGQRWSSGQVNHTPARASAEHGYRRSTHHTYLSRSSHLVRFTLP